MRISFVAAGIGDISTLRAWMDQLYATEGLSPAAGVERALKELIAKSSLGACLLIHVDRAAVGYLVIGYSFSLEFGGRDAFLDELYIEPEVRHQGIGKQAVAHAIDFCKKKGLYALHLEVSRKNPAAQHLYRQCGFRLRHDDYDLLTLRF